MEICALTTERFDEFYTLVEAMVAESEFKDAKPSRERIFEIHKMAHCCIYVAIYRDEIIGFVSGVAQQYFFSDRLRVSDLGLYVIPAQRGSSAAKRLIRALEDWTRHMGITDLYIGQLTALNVDKTMKFYAHQGYSMVGYNTVKHLEMH